MFEEGLWILFSMLIWTSISILCSNMLHRQTIQNKWMFKKRFEYCNVCLSPCSYLLTNLLKHALEKNMTRGQCKSRYYYKWPRPHTHRYFFRFRIKSLWQIFLSQKMSIYIVFSQIDELIHVMLLYDWKWWIRVTAVQTKRVTCVGGL